MKKLVIMPGGFHPFHAGHLALYNAAKEAFPSADVFVAATADTSTRPFPFKLKKILAQAAGVPGNRFIQVKSPFRAEEITQMYDPADTQLIFVRSEKDRDTQPRPGGVKKDGSPAYLQPYKRTGRDTFNRHAYVAYLPVATFGPGMTSATEIRAKWPEMEPEQKIALVKTLYPSTAGNDAAAAKIVAMFDETISRPVEEAVLINDPDAGHQIRPDGGMGTWDEASLVSNLARKFSDMVNMVKNKNYSGLQYVLYQGGAVKSMVDALAQYGKFMDKQGRRPIAQGREIDLAQMSEAPDYIDEADILQFPAERQAPPNLEPATDVGHQIVSLAKDSTVLDPSLQLADLRGKLRSLGYRLRFDQGGVRLIHNQTNWNTIIDPLK
jgi:hypothetical protein